MLALLVAAAFATEPNLGGTGRDGWEAVLERVAPAVVALEVTATRDFDTEHAGTSFGTGFVVDAERGLILTNRHMVHAGPVTARAEFLDNEEAVLRPIYRDPVHDFGFYRFDPADVRYLDLVELPLAPDAAKVGMEIRVIGNDAGEKISILDGTLARLDRNAPFYGGNTYNDFNTFYFQAASNTSGGSSGSPVIDARGRVVALNAGGRTEAASSFYLPLHRVERALRLIREGQPVTRGTLQTTFVHASYEELARLGLTDASEATLRRTFPGGSGTLVVRTVVPEGPADGLLRSGDILLTVDGRLVTDFVTLEDILDEAVGNTVTVGIERLGRPMELQITVQDLHAITPDTYLEVGRAILHPLSYQQARNHMLPVRGVYVATPGYFLGSAGVSAGDLLTHVDGEPVPDLDTLQRVLESKADGQRIRLRHHAVADVTRVRESIAVMDRTWFPMRRCRRDDDAGTWPCIDSPPPPPAPPSSDEPQTPLSYGSGHPKARRLASSLVMVDFDVPYSTEGVSGSSFRGTGVVVDAAKGLVLVDRDTVPVALGDLTLTFAGAVRVPGEVVWLHPLHDYAVVRYDPERLGDLRVRAAKLGSRWLREGARVRVVGLDREGALVSDRAEVEDVDALLVPLSGTPRFRDFNVEVARLAKVDRTVGGVVVGRDRRVLALWASYFFPNSKERYFYGLPSAYLVDVVEALGRGETPAYRWIGAEFVPRSLADARDRGMSDAWIRRFVGATKEIPKVLEVVRLAGGTPAKGLLRETDLVLSADDVPVTRMRDVEAWSRRPLVDLVVLRDGEELAITVPTVELSGSGVRRVVSWAGMLVHEPHFEVAAQRGLEPRGVYIAWYWYGSPAARDGIRPTRRIVQVNDVPTPDLDAFLDAVRGLDPERPVVLELEDLEGVVSVQPVELDLDFWPTELIVWEDGAWTRQRLAP